MSLGAFVHHCVTEILGYVEIYGDMLLCDVHSDGMELENGKPENGKRKQNGTWKCFQK